MLKPIQLFIVAFVLLLFCETGIAQPTIVLRDLTLIRSKTISNFDQEAITLSDGSALQWDQILKAKVSPERQAEFDRNVRQIGLPLFRLKTRITQRSWSGAGEISEPIFEALINSGGNPASINKDLNYLVCMATMKSRLRSDNRPGALLAMERAAEIQPEIDEQTLAIVGSDRLPTQKNQIVLSLDLLPVWFDIKQLEKTVSQNFKQYEAEAAALKLNDRQKIYLASMKIELGDNENAIKLLNQLESPDAPNVNAWRIVLKARMLQRAGEHVKAQSLLDQNVNSFTKSSKPVAIFYRGLSGKELHVKDGEKLNPKNDRTVDFDLSRSALLLMRIPSLYGSRHPSLSAAALFQAAEITKLRGRQQEAEKIKRQLVRTYPWTYHGRIETIKDSQSLIQN